MNEWIDNHLYQHDLPRAPTRYNCRYIVRNLIQRLVQVAAAPIAIEWGGTTIATKIIVIARTRRKRQTYKGKVIEYYARALVLFFD